MSTEPGAKDGWKPPVWLQVFVVGLVASLIAWRFWNNGEQEYRQCVTDRPHDGQCGLASAMGEIYGAFFGGGILIVGLTVVTVFYFRTKPETKE